MNITGFFYSYLNTNVINIPQLMKASTQGATPTVYNQMPSSMLFFPHHWDLLQLFPENIKAEIVKLCEL